MRSIHSAVLPLLVGLVMMSASCSSDAPVSSTAGLTGTELPALPQWRDEVAFDDPQTLAQASSAVVAATVMSVESIGVVDATEDLHPSEYFRITAAVDDELFGAIDSSTITIGWEGFVTDGQVRTGRLVIQGISMPDKGDQLLLFLRPEDAARATLLDLGSDAWAINTLDGILWIDAGKLATDLVGSGRPAHALRGMTPTQVAALITG